VFVPAGATDGRYFYVFGGMAFSADGQYRPSAAAHRFDTATRAWQTLRELPEPRVGAASPCAVTSEGRILVIGGYAEVYPGAMRNHPGFSPQTFVYDIAKGEWELGAVLPERDIPERDSPGDPGVGPMLGAPCAVWENMAVVIGGESRGSARTPAVIAWPLSNGDARPRNSRDEL
jgi:N-acetylneuraminic acid mutarotase